MPIHLVNRIVKNALHEAEPEIADILVPNCVYRGGCPEMTTCGLWKRLIALSDGAILTDNIQARYDIYNAIYARMRNGSNADTI